MPPKLNKSSSGKPSKDDSAKASGGITAFTGDKRKATAIKIAASLMEAANEENRQLQERNLQAQQVFQSQQAAAGGGAFQQQAAAGGEAFQQPLLQQPAEAARGVAVLDPKMVSAAFAAGGGGGGGAAVAGGRVHELMMAENELDDNMLNALESSPINVAFGEYHAKVVAVLSDNSKSRSLLPQLDKIFNRLSETVFMGAAPLGVLNPDADETNCSRVYRLCLEVTKNDIKTLSYAWELYKTYRDTESIPIPYVGAMLASLRPIMMGATFGISLLSYRYTLIWLSNQFTLLGGGVVLDFLQKFALFMSNPRGPNYQVFREEHERIFHILDSISNQFISLETLVILIHQYCSRQHRLSQQFQGALPVQAPRNPIMGWNIPFSGFFQNFGQISAGSILRLFRPDLACVGFDPSVPVMSGIVNFDQTLSSVLLQTSHQIQLKSDSVNVDRPADNPFVKAHLRMKFRRTFETQDGSVNPRLFITVMVEERNTYVKLVIDGLMSDGQTSYLQARAILINVYPGALDFCISTEALVRSGVSVASDRSTASSAWTIRGSSAHSIWQLNQEVLEQAKVDNTFLSRIASSGIWFLKTAAETLMYGTQGVATLPGMPEAPPAFQKTQSPEQQLAVSRAVHAVQVFDKWVETVESDAVFRMMQATEFMETVSSTLTKEHVDHCVGRVKDFCRLTSKIEPLDDGTLLYVVNPDTVTGLQDAFKDINTELGAKVFNGCLSAILEFQRMIIHESNRQAAAAAGVDMVGVLGGPRQNAGSEEQQLNLERDIVALNALIPPAAVIAQVANPALAAGGGGGGVAGSFNLSQDLGDQDPGMFPNVDVDEQGGGRSRSRKRSASKRTRRKAKQPSKKLERKSRRYVRRRRSTRRKN